jgi:hypothetical protein
VPPLTCILSFVRLLHIRQPDNTMASTRSLALPEPRRRDEFDYEDEFEFDD